MYIAFLQSIRFPLGDLPSSSAQKGNPASGSLLTLRGLVVPGNPIWALAFLGTLSMQEQSPTFQCRQQMLAMCTACKPSSSCGSRWGLGLHWGAVCWSGSCCGQGSVRAVALPSVTTSLKYNSQVRVGMRHT